MWAAPAHAADYTVGPGKQYATLQALQAANIAWNTGDTVTIFGDDASLQDVIDFGAADTTVTGSGTILSTGTGFNFGTWGAVTGSVNAAPGQTPTFTGFGASGINGGVFYGGVGGTLNIGTASGGTLEFLANRGDWGGAVCSNGTVNLNGDLRLEERQIHCLRR